MALTKVIGAGLGTLTENQVLGGTTPTLTIGDAGAEDTKIVFDLKFDQSDLSWVLRISQPCLNNTSSFLKIKRLGY